jgi:hypothetical protein
VKVILKIRFEKIRRKISPHVRDAPSAEGGKVCPSFSSKRRAIKKERRTGRVSACSVSVEEKFSLAFP